MRIEALEAWFREVTGFFVFYLLVPPWLYLFSLVVYHLLSFLTTEGLRDHWGGNPGDKSGAFVISSSSLWEMKTITKNKYFVKIKDTNTLGVEVFTKMEDLGPRYHWAVNILPLGAWHQWTGHWSYCTWRYRCVFFTLSWKAWVNVGNDYIDVQM